jgi:hypothetical protein
MIPLYCRKAVRVLTNSDTLGEELVRYVGVPRSKLRTVYASADRSFRPIADSAALAEVRARYGLPQEPFLLMVVKGHRVVARPPAGLPSRYESFGIPIVEAMACGCPVITATTSACPEVAGDAAILVDPDDVEGLASAMYRVSLDDDLAEDLRRRGLRRAEGFSWAESARTLLNELAGAARQGQAAHASHPA